MLRKELVLARKEYRDEKNANTLLTSERPLCRELNEKCVTPLFSQVSQ